MLRSDRLIRLLTAVSVQAKILGMVGGLVLLMGVTVTLQVRAQLSHLLFAELDARADALGRDLAARASDLVLTGNRYALRELLKDAVRHNPDVRYAFLLNPEGRVIAHSFEGGVPAGLAALSSGTTSAAPRRRVLESEEGRLTDIEVPVLAGRAGVARAGLSHARLRAAIRDTTIQLLVATALAFGGALAIATMLTRILVRPVLELVDVTRQVSGGNLEVRAVQHAEDEVGELAAAFNNMVQALARSQADLLRRMRELGTLSATTTLVTRGVSLDDTLQSALEHVVAVMEAPGGSIVLTGEGGTVRQAASCGEPVAMPGRPGASREADPQPGPAAARGDGRTLGAQADGLPCHVEVPLTVRERTLGVMRIACRPAACRFSPEDMSLLEAVGRQLGLVVEHARLWADADARRARQERWVSEVIRAQEAERRRISRELHDQAGQLLTALLVRLRSLEQASGIRDEQLRDVLDLRELVRQLMDELHRLAVELRPAAIDQLGLVGALEGYVREFGARTGIVAKFERSSADAALDATPDVEIAVYRVVQEALTNVARHAEASEVDVLVGRRDGSLVAVIEDNGRGFDVEAQAAEGHRQKLGLFGMRERAELLGGRLSVESAPGAGTTVVLEIPLGGSHDPRLPG
jgi:signal transduction histidine kinase